MQTQIRAIGNSQGMTIPSKLLKELHLSKGDVIDIVAVNGGLLIKPAKAMKPKYSLNELLALCDENAQISKEAKDFIGMAAMGNEEW